MLFKAPIPSLPFIKWLFSSKENRVLLIVSIVVSIIVFIWHKTFYPLPNFFPDSYQYIAGAMENRAIDFRPIGYTKFLQLIHSISSSHLFLVWTQYFLLQLSQLYLLFTISYLLQPGKWAFRTLIIVCLVNPIILHVSNLVSSDALFAALNLVWLTQLFWIIAKPNLRLILIHAVVLVMAFTVRYNAIYFPFISTLVIIWCGVSKKEKRIGLAFTFILLGSFIGFTQMQFMKQTKIVQSAPFSGWQVAANALQAYSHVSPVSPESVPGRFKELQTMVNKYLDSIHRISHNPFFESSFFYMWDVRSPLLQYSKSSIDGNYEHPEFKNWASVARPLSDYGFYLIETHPGAYLKYYLLPNMLLFNQPETEYLGWYNMGKPIVGPIMVKWFRLPSNEIRFTDKNPPLSFLSIISESIGPINLIMIIGFLVFLAMRGFSKCTLNSRRVLLIMLLFWIANSGFSIIASPIHLRYLTVQIIVTSILVFLLLEFIVLEYLAADKQPISKEPLVNPIPIKNTRYENV